MKFKTLLILLLVSGGLQATEYHVSTKGSDDTHSGTAESPFRTISAAAAVAQPGDTVTVHTGTYRERINPPRGGLSEEKRITYQAAPGEQVTITGSELVTGWKKVGNDTWKVEVPNTHFGDFNPYADLIHGDWFKPNGRQHHTGAVYLNGHWLTEAVALEEVMKPQGESALWFATVGDTRTTIHAQFKDADPNKDRIEINVRQSVFYPDQPGRNFITVRGFTLEHAATPWAPPTAEQVGLIGTHWSKGWIIEHNTIRYSTCSGVTLGKYGDERDNKAQSAKGYNVTIRDALDHGWSKENIGHHIVRDNHISHCEQAVVVGSMGAAFSTISHNHIHHIHVRRLFGGAEMAAIKFHAAIDTVISDNHIDHNYRGIWLDWMAQGTRVTRNLLHDNEPSCDLFMEVDHGPFLIDNNLFLSPISLMDWSEGGAYVHNLISGEITARSEQRQTPYHQAHSTTIAGLKNITNCDSRFFNNIFLKGSNLKSYEKRAGHLTLEGNVFVDTGFQLREENGTLQLTIDGKLPKPGQTPQLITSKTLGKAMTPDLPFEQADGSPYRLDTDYLGQKRSPDNISAGPFLIPDPAGPLRFSIWPRED